jgi:hypothetical protein
MQIKKAMPIKMASSGTAVFNKVGDFQFLHM